MPGEYSIQEANIIEMFFCHARCVGVEVASVIISLTVAFCLGVNEMKVILCLSSLPPFQSGSVALLY